MSTEGQAAAVGGVKGGGVWRCCRIFELLGWPGLRACAPAASSVGEAQAASTTRRRCERTLARRALGTPFAGAFDREKLVSRFAGWGLDVGRKVGKVATCMRDAALDWQLRVAAGPYSSTLAQPSAAWEGPHSLGVALGTTSNV